MQFMLTPDFQKTLPTTNWMYPVIDMPLPPVYDKMPKPAKTLEFDAKKWRKSAISGYGYGKTQSAVNCRVPDTGALASGLLLVVAVSAFGALWFNTPDTDWQQIWDDSYLWHVVRFTFWQAFLSALFSVIPLFSWRALWRRRFRDGRSFCGYAR